MISSSLSELVIDSAARSVIMAAVVGVGLALSGTRNVVAQKAAWTLVLLAALLMPAVAPWAAGIPGLPKVAAIRLPHGPGAADSATDSAVESTMSADRGQRQRVAQPVTAVSPSSVARASDVSSLSHFPSPTISSGDVSSRNSGSMEEPVPARRSLKLADLLFLLYFAGCAGLLVRMGMGLTAALRLWISAEQVEHPSIPPALHVRASDALASPVTIGSGIVLPSDFTGWDDEKLHIVLAHEASHVRQGDFYLQLCAALYTALFWFSPLGWLLKRKLSGLSETISDRAAVERAASHATYAQVLLEFAALPRPIPTGVAMANHGHVISRIERLLNESSFRQAFAGGRARVASAVLLVPVALYAATALVRVEAAQEAPPPPAAPAIAGAPVAPAIAVAPPSGPAAPEVSAEAPAAVIMQSETPAAPAPPAAAPAAPAVAPAPPAGDDTTTMVGSQVSKTPDGETVVGSYTTRTNARHGYSYSYSSNGDSYAVVSGHDNVSFSGDWFEGRKAELDKARTMAHGDFLWFTHDGKSYVMDDPQIVAQIKQMYAPMEALGEQQRKLGEQQRALGEKQRALGEKQRQVSVRTPEMSEAIAQVEAAAAALRAAKGKEITEEKLADMQAKLADMQSKLGELQGQMGEKQGELGEQQGKLGEQQGKLGEQQGRLGEEQGRIAQETDKKVKSIIDESLKNGKAKQVQ